LAAEICHGHFPHAVMLMDDGFQHLPLKKHLTVVLDDPNPKNRHCLPAGPYREPRRNRRRADLVLPDRFRVLPEPARFRRPDGTEADTPTDYSVLCALGQPDKFLKALQSNAPTLQRPSALLLPDHDPLDAGTLLEQLPADRPVVVTAKDWVKLRERPDVGSREFLIAMHAVRVTPEDDFRAWIKARLDGITAQSAPQ
jgi:tetraacyldisaccharide 4'-kinase